MSLYVKLQTTYYQDEKLIAAGEAAELLYVRALCKAKELPTEGVLTLGQLLFLGLPDTPARAAKLVEVGAFEVVAPNSWRIAAWLKHNPSQEQIEHISSVRSNAAKQRHQTTTSNLQANCTQDAVQVVQQSVSKPTVPLLCSAVPAVNSASPVPPSEHAVAVPDAADDEPAVVSDWAADDPTYEADPRYSAQAELELWEARVGPIQPRDAMMSATALIRLHLHCKRSVREIRALIEHVAADPDARKWWGAGKSPARWLSSRDGGEPTWCKIRAHWQGAGGKLHGNGKIRRIEIPPGPAPAVDPACDCRRGFITVDGHREGCPKCSRGQHIRAGGRL